MKNSIKWHEERLKNMTISAQRRRQVANCELRAAEELESNVEFLTRQIEAAKKSGKTEFDPEKYLVKRKAK
ncbi:MAG: hypothetical protein KGL39_41000 [Patescibacteria group bacterium]|nr:hypothetical protein [Patescibacteria group bacterium]